MSWRWRRGGGRRALGLGRCNGLAAWGGSSRQRRGKRVLPSTPRTCLPHRTAPPAGLLLGQVVTPRGIRRGRCPVPSPRPPSMPATGATPEGEVIVTINPLQLSAVQLSARHCVGRSWVAASGLDGFVCASAPCSKSRKDSPQRHRDTEKSAGALCGVAPLGGRRFEAPRVAAALCLCVSVVNILACDDASTRDPETCDPGDGREIGAAK